ncbi:MAG: DNA polymerase I [Bacteroidales bacterium]|nr:DNA polymerase I [Bacteroidales bacterium]
MKQHPEKVFLFDAYALIFRAYYAFINRPMINSGGTNTSAIYGFTTALTDILNREKPDYAAVVFDPPTPTFRHQLYSEYKANRLATPEEIKKSVPVIKEIISAFNIPVIEVAGFEADDVIGTLAKKAAADGYQVFMVTPDKDYMQLITEHIKMYKPGRSGGDYETLGVAEVKTFFGVETPLQVIDILALWGDSSDNIPGAPGIGEKSARELISKYGSVQNLLEHVGELKPRQQESLGQNREKVLLSYELATINLGVPIDFVAGELKTTSWDMPRLTALFRQLEFKTLLGRLTRETSTPPLQGSLFEAPAGKLSESADSSLQNISTVSHQYHLVDTDAKVKALVDKLVEQQAFCFDTETTGLNTRKAELVGLAFSFNAHEAFYIPVPERRSEAMELLDQLRKVFERTDIRKVGQNLKFDIQVLMNYGISVEGELFDTMIAHYLLQPDLKHNLDYLAEIYLQYSMVSIETLIGKKGPQQRNMREVDLDAIREYTGEDADITWQVYRLLLPELEKQGLLELALKAEMPLVRVLAEMENAGFRIDQKSLNQYSSLLKKELADQEKYIYSLSGTIFNINSPKQLGEVLFEKLNISEGAQKTKTKQYSTGEEVLLKLTDKHPVVSHILDYRAIQKLISTYVDALPQLLDDQSGKIHTTFDQAWVSTGRLSSRNPNLQNIPIRDERGKEIRKAFVPSGHDYLLLSADYSQIELRLMAHLSQDENMLDAFSHQADIHVSTAARIFKVKDTEVTSSMRSKAKTANFGIIYGISAFGLSQRLNIPRSEAADLIQGYFASFPRVKEYMEKSVKLAREKGYVQTLMGRRRYLPDIHSSNAIVRGVAERNAINAPIQGSAADIIKLAMVNLQRILRKGYRSKLILQIHDELILDVLREEAPAVKEIVKQAMENVMSLSVPLTVDIGMGENWLEAH